MHAEKGSNTVYKKKSYLDWQYRHASLAFLWDREKRRCNVVQVHGGRKVSNCLESCKLVQCAHKLAPYLKLINLGVRAVVMCNDLENTAIYGVPSIVLACSKITA